MFWLSSLTVWWPAGALVGSARVGVATSSHGTSSMNRPARRSSPSLITSSGQPTVPAETAVRAALSAVSNTGGALAARYTPKPGIPAS